MSLVVLFVAKARVGLVGLQQVLFDVFVDVQSLALNVGAVGTAVMH